MAPRPKSDPITKPCDNCGKPITRQVWDFRAHAYCDHACYTSSANHAKSTSEHTKARFGDTEVSLICPECATVFTRYRSQVVGRKQTFCSTPCRSKYRREAGKKFLNQAGYVVVGVPAEHPGAKKNGKYGQILEHRKVMQEILGRPLMGIENVHHINGVRDDNRPENLELWVKSQPAGQRAEDKVKWAREMLALYGDLFPET